MSYSMRGDSPILGGGTLVELPNGAGQSTLAAIQIMEPVGIFGAAAATLAVAKYCVFIAPPAPTATAPATFPLGAQYKILGGSYIFNTASASGTFAVEVCAAGTADGSGTNVLSTSTVSTASGAGATPTALTLNTNVDNLLVAPNSRVNIIIAGTQTGLVNFTLALFIARTQ